jgi:hypothetical protein
MRHRTTVRLDDELLRLAKTKAAKEGRSLTSLIEEGLRHVVQAEAARPAKFYPRVSAASGGPRPGVDLRRTSELLELLDDELPPEKRR